MSICNKIKNFFLYNENICYNIFNLFHDTDDLINSGSICSICLEFNNTECVTILPCNHKFHSKCIKKWMKTKKTCPICRNIIKNI